MKKLDKDYLKAESRKLEASLIGFLYHSLVHDVPKVKQFVYVRRILDGFVAKIPELSSSEAREIKNTCIKKLFTVQKMAQNSLRKLVLKKNGINYQEIIQNRSNEAFNIIEKWLINTKTISHSVDCVISHTLSRAKKSELDEMMAGEGNIFYICSYNTECAQDHAAYQGKIYVDSSWATRCSDTDRAKISAFIKNKGIMTIQKAINAPVYMCTRPNCSHYFKTISVEDALSKSASKILKEKNMIQEGSRHDTRSSALRSYKNRLDLKSMLWKIMPCNNLAKSISHDKQLIKKWQKIGG